MVQRGRSSASQLNAIAKALDGAAEDVVRKVELRAMQALSSATPVDTGFARSSWTPAVGSAVANAGLRPTDRAEASSVAQARLQENLSKAERIAQSYRIRQGKVFITTAVPYMVFLNAGSSSQAPTNFVERALAQAVNSVVTT